MGCKNPGGSRHVVNRRTQKPGAPAVVQSMERRRRLCAEWGIYFQCHTLQKFLPQNKRFQKKPLRNPFYIVPHRRSDFMSKRKFFLIVGLLATLFLACWYFLVPRPVIQTPENKMISSILIQCDSYYQETADDSFYWVPETEEDQAVAQRILEYLSQCQEQRTLHWKFQAPPLSWKCMYIFVTDTQQSTFPRERRIVLGPSQSTAPDQPKQSLDTVNLSCWSTGRGVWGRFQGNLQNPSAIRDFVLDSLNLPADFM